VNNTTNHHTTTASFSPPSHRFSCGQCRRSGCFCRRGRGEENRRIAINLHAESLTVVLVLVAVQSVVALRGGVSRGATTRRNGR
jgi:hypothetical protein